MSDTEVIRQHKRDIERAIRQLEQEHKRLEMQEKKSAMDMKKLAKENNPKALRIMAKDIVRIRKNKEKFVDLVCKMRAVSLQITTMASTHQLMDSIKGATKAMRVMNQQMNMPMLSQILQEFAKQTEMMDMSSEMVGEGLDMAFDDEEMEDETENVVNQILDEYGISFEDSLVAAPTGKNKQQTTTTTSKEDELEARLKKLGQ